MLKSLLPEPVESSVRDEQIRLLYHQGVTIQLLGIATAVVAVVMLWKVADALLLGIWLGTMTVIYLLRLALAMRFNQTRESVSMETWCRIYTVGTFLSGVGWGALAFFTIPAGRLRIRAFFS